MIFNIKDKNGHDLSQQITLTPVFAKNGVQIFEIDVKAFHGTARLSWTQPMQGHISTWHPLVGRNRALPQWFCSHKANACFYRGAPVLATVRANGNIHTTVALADTVTPSMIEYYVDDFSQNYEVIFVVEIEVCDNYRTQLRIDQSDTPLCTAIQDIALWWNADKTKILPEDAFLPLYSSWYNFHQTPNQKDLTKELKTAAQLGFKTVILDDGWQIEGDGTKDYRKSGDWVVAQDKFPDFKQFVNDVHAFGQKLILWFAVPFAGYETKAYQSFRDKLLFTEDGYLYAGILDIRYAEVREYITNTYLRYVKEYDIDGLKLDFIDNFKTTDNTPAYNSQMDCLTVEQAVTELLREIYTGIQKLKPDFLYEFRQFYVGPSILRFANMIRVADCAFDSVTNRIGIADLRMLTHQTAVHSDMLLWSPHETAEGCMFQLLNIAFGVPQISVLLHQSSPEQQEVLKAFLDYVNKNRDVLLKGKFFAKHPELNYTLLSSSLNGKKITVLYGENTCEISDEKEDIWNATADKGIFIKNTSLSSLKITVYDFYGNVLQSFYRDEAFFYADVPVYGSISVEKQ